MYSYSPRPWYCRLAMDALYPPLTGQDTPSFHSPLKWEFCFISFDSSCYDCHILPESQIPKAIYASQGHRRSSPARCPLEVNRGLKTWEAAASRCEVKQICQWLSDEGSLICDGDLIDERNGAFGESPRTFPIEKLQSSIRTQSFTISEFWKWPGRSCCLSAASCPQLYQCGGFPPSTNLDWKTGAYTGFPL